MECLAEMVKSGDEYCQILAPVSNSQPLTHCHISLLISSLMLWTYHILPDKHACLNKSTPRLLTLPGHILETTELISIKFSALILRYICIDEFTQLFSLRSDKVEGQFSASAPDTFFQRNMVHVLKMKSIWKYSRYAQVCRVTSALVHRSNVDEVMVNV